MRILSIHEPARAGGNPRASHRALHAHRFILRFALAAANLFAWIFIFQYFYIVSTDMAHAFARTALLYVLCQLVTCLATPLSARLLRYGARRGLIVATFLVATAFVALGATLEGLWDTPYAPILGIVAFSILIGAYRAFYWLPYEAEVHAEGEKGRSIWQEILIALAPIVAGIFLVMDPLAPIWLLFAAGAILALSALPLRSVREVHERLMWTYRETFAEFMAPEHRDLVRRSLMEGAFGAALLFLWPITVFLIVGWSYSLLGIILSITFLLGILGRGVVRRALRALQVHRSPLVSTLLVVSPWILRLAVATPLGVILVDSYFYMTAPKRLGMDPAVFEQSSDAGFFLDEYPVLKEMGLALGRIAMCALAAALTLLLSLPVALVSAFVVAAFLSIWSAR